MIAGYLLGIAGKIVTHNVNYVLAVYLLDLAMVSVDLVLTLRNRKLDRMAAAQGCPTPRSKEYSDKPKNAAVT